MSRALAGLVSGILFGLGLAVSQMVNPAKVLAFLDVAGDWDPSLAFVMGGALVLLALAQRFVFELPHPVLAREFMLPATRSVDGRLLVGAALFGVGWGLVGLCPGPTLAALAYGRFEVLVFAASMVAGALVHNLWTARRVARPRTSAQD